MDFELLDRDEEGKGNHDGEGNDWEREQRARDRRNKVLSSDKDAVVSPFAIRNLTESEIVIKK